MPFLRGRCGCCVAVVVVFGMGMSFRRGGSAWGRVAGIGGSGSALHELYEGGLDSSRYERNVRFS